MGFAVDVAGQIFCGPTDLEQHLLDPAPLAGMHDHGIVVDSGAQHRGDLLVAQDFLKHRAVQTQQHQPVHGTLDQLQPAVAGHGVDDVDQKRLRNSVAGVADQSVDHLLGIVARRTRVPQCQRGDPVGMDVLRCPFQFGEWRDSGSRGTGHLVVDLQQDGFIGLDDQWSVGHAVVARETVARG